MRANRRTMMSTLCGLAALVMAVSITAAPDPTLSQAQQAVSKGLDYLRHTQETDGSWSHYPATTALAAAAFLRNGRTERNDPALEKAITSILHSVKPSGAIYSDANAATALPNYNTALCLMALALTHNPGYRTVIANAQRYLEKSQFDEEEGVSPKDPTYGGIGYGSHPDRPDLSNLQMALESLKDSGVGKSNPVWSKALIFLQRVQNRRESNDQDWAKNSSNDGGFIYDSKGRTFAEAGGTTSYGSMTYAGLKSYIYCGVSKSDPRAQAAWDWIRAHYTVMEHPGMGNTSLYYYYHTMAKTFDVYGQKVIKDTAGKPHDWAHDLAAQFIATQHPDGSWFNSNARFWENQPSLVTSYTLIALSYCLKHA